jgi:hypothetical protein
MTARQHANRIREALEAAQHIAECGDHPEHLLDAENKARTAFPSLAALVQEADEAREALRAVERRFDAYTRRDVLDKFQGKCAEGLGIIADYFEEFPDA